VVVFYDGESLRRCLGVDGWFRRWISEVFSVPAKVLAHEVSGDDWKRDYLRQILYEGGMPRKLDRTFFQVPIEILDHEVSVVEVAAILMVTSHELYSHRKDQLLTNKEVIVAARGKSNVDSDSYLCWLSSSTMR
jgi:hypothetical protein